ncbi:MAG: hypothetical protein OXC13_06930 [Caldilineaceae bacterium]|nr:hypothetical protein [Caldilineaceae bacterium]
MPQTCLLVDAVLPRIGSPADRALAIVDYRRARNAAARRAHARRRRRYCAYLFQRHQALWKARPAPSHTLNGPHRTAIATF